jgi:hypothetical protein
MKKEFFGKGLFIGDFVIYNSDGNLTNRKHGIWKIIGVVEKSNDVILRNVSNNNEFKANANSLMSLRFLSKEDYDKYLTPSALAWLIKYQKTHEYLNSVDNDLGYVSSYKEDYAVQNSTIVNKSDKGETKMKNGTVGKVVNNNVSAAQRGAMLSAGKTLNNFVRNKVADNLPRKYRGLLKYPVANVVVANIASFAVQNFAASNEKANMATQAMMEAAMAEFFDSFNLEKIISDVLSEANLDTMFKEVRVE